MVEGSIPSGGAQIFICRLLKLKEKYEYIFNEKLTMYDTKIKQILNTNEIPSNVKCKRFITQKLKNI